MPRISIEAIASSEQAINAIFVLIALYATIKALNVYRKTRDWKFLIILCVMLIFATQSFIAFAGVRFIGFIRTTIHYIYIIPLILFLIYDRIEARRLKEKKEKEKVRALFGRYVAASVIDKLMREAEIKLGGTREQITILYSDIRGFTKMAEKLPPEEVVDILNMHFNVLTDVILKYEGTLDKYIGDSAMVIYNAPIKQKDHAVRAVKTAIEIQREMEKLNKKLRKKKKKEIYIGIGINTGDAVIGNIGSHKFMDYTAVGDTINTAARLVAAANPGEVVLSETTYKLAKEALRGSDVSADIIKAKGKAKAIKVFRVKAS